MGSTTIQPGQEVQVLLDLPMGMHSGMDGDHLFRVKIPIRDETGQSGELQVYFKALFK